MRASEKLHIHQWAVKNNVGIAMAIAAQGAATMGVDLFRLAMMARERKLDRYALQARRPAEWLQLYQDHRRVLRAVGDKVGGIFGNGQRADSAIDIVALAQEAIKENSAGIRAEFEKMGSQRLQRELFRAWRFWKKRYRRHLDGLLGDLEEQESNHNLVVRNEAALDSLEMEFAVGVFMPCMVEYESSPFLLFSRACAGDVNAIEKLVRVDATVIHTAAIGEWMGGGPSATRRARKEMVGDWMKKGLNGRISIRGVKESLGALISIMSQMMSWRWVGPSLEKMPLTARQIRDLFDDVARDRRTSAGQLYCDPDLAELNLEAWQKAIQRRRKGWLEGIPWGVDKSQLG